MSHVLLSLLSQPPHCCSQAVPEAIQTANRYFTPGDPSLSYPYKSNTISSTVLYILVFIWPGCMFLLIAGLRRSFADG